MIHADHYPAKRAKIVITTYPCLSEGPIEIEKRAIAIALNPADLVVNPFALNALAVARKARFYGLLPNDVQLPPFSRDRVTALFG
ncbi:unnamed protein product, partial [marine sediment metagenome]